MLTSPVAQLVSCWTSDLKVGRSRPEGWPFETRRLVVRDQSGTHRDQILFSLVSDGSLADICVVDFMLP